MNKDRIQGALIGVALGDAIGMEWEFKSNRNGYTGLLTNPHTSNNRFLGRRTLALGQVTDDTEMMLQLLRSIANHGNYDTDDVIRSYMEWANSGQTMRGKNTSALFYGIKTVKGYHSRFAKQFPNDTKKNAAQSNGALMRCAPLMFLSDDDVIKDCMLSNPSVVAVDCNKTYIRFLRSLVMGQPIPLNELKAETNEVQDVIDSITIDNPKVRDCTNNRGWCLHGLWCALWCYNNFKTFQDAMDFIIMLPGITDTDTNAAIVGAIFGAKIGYNAMVREDKTGHNMIKVFEADIENSDIKRDLKYHPRNIPYIIDHILHHHNLKKYTNEIH